MYKIMEKIEKVSINPIYDIPIGDTETIINSSSNVFELAYNCFKAGYMQGQKAEKSANKKNYE